MDGPAWPVLLQHDSMRGDLQLVCCLLRCSKMLRAAMSRSAGQLTLCIGQRPCGPAADLQAEGRQYEHLATWISANGRLLHTLDISEGASKCSGKFPAEALFASALAAAADSAPRGTSMHSNSGGGSGGGADGDGTNVVAEAAADMEGAVQAAEQPDAGVTNSENAAAAVSKTELPETANAAAAAHVERQPLALQAFSAANITSPALLQHLPAQLRNLSISLSVNCTFEQAQQITSHLSRLTGLTQLRMNISKRGLVLMPALLSLRHLQVLELHAIAEVAALQHLPQQLKQLQLSYASGSTAGALQLQHLKALTALDCCTPTASRPVSAGDDLPPGMVRLGAAVQHLEPVLALSHLQRLEIAVESSAAASQLGRLTALQALTALHLETTRVAAAGAALLQLPIQHLKVSGDLPTVAVQQLGQLQGLTSLLLARCSLQGPYKQLSESLQKLTGLQQLLVQSVSSELWQDNAGLSLQFVTALPDLQSFRVMRMSLDPATITPLQAATGLTCLEIVGSGRVQDWDVADVVQQLSSPPVLSYDHHLQYVATGVLPAIAQLTHETFLYWRSTGVVHLRLLQHLSLDHLPDVTSAVLPHIAHLTRLTYLNLSRTAVNLLSVTCLTALHQLKELNLAVLPGCPSWDCPSGHCPSEDCRSGGCPSHWSTAVNMAVVVQLTSLSHLTRLWLSSSAFDARAFPGSPQNFKSMLRESLPYCEVLMV